MLDPRLRALLDAPATATVLTDFDGTLSAIVDDPAATVPLPGAVEALRACAARFRTVAVVSGRPADFLLATLGDGVRLSALYGLESVVPGTGGRIEVLPAAEPFRAIAEAVADEAEAGAPPGIRVERKGLSLTVHHREAPRSEAWVAAFVEGAAIRTGLEVHRAKQSYELRAPLRIDKGSVVLDLADGCTAACYLGDDVGDLPAFAALDVLSAQGVTTCKVAVDSLELDERVRAQADLLLPSPEACVALLQELAGA